MMSGLDIRYDLGAGHPLLGRRMPDLDLVTESADRPVRADAGQTAPGIMMGSSSLRCQATRLPAVRPAPQLLRSEREDETHVRKFVNRRDETPGEVYARSEEGSSPALFKEPLMAEDNRGVDRSNQIEDTQPEIPQGRDDSPSTPLSNPPAAMDREQDEGEEEAE